MRRWRWVEGGGELTGPISGGMDGLTVRPGLKVCDLFAILWDGLADLLGTAATATLLKRAARRAAHSCPELGKLLIVREGLAYGYTCPTGWSAEASGAPPPLRSLIRELKPLLIEMTGQLVIQHLEQILELREPGLLAPEEEPP